MDDVLILGYLEKCWVAWLLTDMYRVAPQQNIAWNTAYTRQNITTLAIQATIQQFIGCTTICPNVH